MPRFACLHLEPLAAVRRQLQLPRGSLVLGLQLPLGVDEDVALRVDGHVPPPHDVLSDEPREEGEEDEGAERRADGDACDCGA